MSFAEVSYRLRERGRTELEREGLYRPPQIPAGQSFKTCLAQRAGSFYRGAQPSIRDFVARNFPQWIDASRREANQSGRHQVDLLNMGLVKLGHPINWHRDPYSGKGWERIFWAEYRPEQDSWGRDSRVIHELNRHQHLPRLGKTYLLSGDERYAAEASAQMLSWVEQNPTGIGINWQSSLEIAIRSLSWLWTLFFLRTSEALTESAAQTIGASLFAQLDHIQRHLSLYSSPNTHLIGEAAALFIAGMVFDQDKWRQPGLNILTAEAEKQILADGVHAENSSYYHCYALDFYLQAWILARQNGHSTLPGPVTTKLRAMIHALMHLTRPDGTLPLFGDDDGGRALALGHGTYRSFNDALCVGSILFREESFKKLSGGFAEEALWYFGENAWDDFRSIVERTPRDRQLFCPQSGYLSQRTGWARTDSHLVFDFGGLGTLTGGHSHANSLSVTLFARGKELLVDPGTYVYNSAPDWRRHFRSTAAHNTVTVDGQDQAAMAGIFGWSSGIEWRGSRRTGLPVDYAEGEHHGYQRLGITHRRAVVQAPGEYWILLDELRGSGSHRFDFHFHFGPEVTVESLECGPDSVAAWSATSGLYLASLYSAPMTAELFDNSFSRGYGHKQSSRSLRVCVQHPAPVWAATFLIPSGDRPVLRRMAVASGEAVACSRISGGVEDLVVLPCGRSEVAVAGFRMAGEFFWVRRVDGQIQSAVAIGRRRFQYGERNLLEDALCTSSAAI